MEAADRGIQTWWYGPEEVGTYFTKRGKRTYRGREVN